MASVTFTLEDELALITLNRPPANALSTELLSELSAVFDELETNEQAKVIIIQGEGRFFAAGADIKEFTTVATGDEFAELARNGQRLFDRIEKFSKPVIAAIHGAALGGGLELAMACHLRLVTDDTKLGLPELTLGLIPGYAGSQRLPRLVGLTKATEMLLTSEPVTGAEAVSIGLANYSYSEQSLMMEEAKKLAKKIAAKSAVTLRLSLELLSYVKDANFDAGVEKEAQSFGVAFDSHDGKEGIQAFIEKRKANFKDR